jgi:hypothetical protein
MDEEISGQHADGTRAGIKIGNKNLEILRISKKSLMSSEPSGNREICLMKNIECRDGLLDDP